MALAFDPELQPWLSMLPQLDITDPQEARALMQALNEQKPAVQIPDGVRITRQTVCGASDEDNLEIYLLTPDDPAGSEQVRDRPAIVYMHGGGFVLGSAATDLLLPAQLCASLGAVVVSVDYRLAPEFPFPAAIHDCYAALEWVAARASTLGVDPGRIAIAGVSAGAGLAAGVALRARDLGGPQICFQLLDIPELDDRLETPSMRAFADTPIWHRPNAVQSWQHYLGPVDGRGQVSPYAAPARAADLGGLPPAYVSVCEFDPLRDEGMAYAQRLLQAGVSTELHVFPGTFHGASGALPMAGVSQRMRSELIGAMGRGLAR